MKLECTVEELIKIVSAKQTDTIKIKEPALQSDSKISADNITCGNLVARA